MVTCGQKSFVSDELNIELENFFKNYNSVISLDYMSNLNIKEGINTTVCMDGRYITKKKSTRIDARYHNFFWWTNFF